MAVLQYIKVHEKSRRLTLTLLDGEEGELLSLSVPHDVYVAIGSPARGDVLTEDVLAPLREQDERYRALRQALYLLSFADNSRAQLVRKLRGKGYSAAAANGAAEEAVRLGYIKERDQLRRQITMLANQKLYGRRRIAAALTARGYRAGEIAEVIGELTSEGEIDFEDNFRRLCDKRGDGTSEGRAKLRYTYGYGGEG